jgi:hypothetical protein
VIDEMEQLEQLCAAVPSPDRQRLTAARAQLSTAIRRETAGHAARRPRLAVSLALRHRRLSRRWLGWAAPLAAAAAVTGVILGSQGAFSPVHRPVPSSSTRDPGPGLAHPATAYVAGQSGTVTPILTATGTALRSIPIGHAWPSTMNIAITPDSKTAYVVNASTGTITPIRTATGTALTPITSGHSRLRKASLAVISRSPRPTPSPSRSSGSLARTSSGRTRTPRTVDQGTDGTARC